MRQLKKFILLAFCLNLVACSTTTQPQNPPLPANLKSPCKAAELLKEGADMGDLLQAATDAVYSLADCSARQRALVKACETR